uniref:Mating-type protein MAT1-1-2 n=1 Tax=Berkeleyomyces basicola TaxID=124036 RepID=A0A3G2LVZ2_9PEZI|nr:mating-type protein MAT1-1-2 [Berkeleyomyces basicola]
MSTEFNKIASEQLEREIPISLSQQCIDDLHRDVSFSCLQHRLVSPVTYDNFFTDHLGKDAVGEVMAVIDMTMSVSRQPIVSSIRALSTHLNIDYERLVHRSLHLWKNAALPFILDLDLTRGVALQGYRAVILTANLWEPTSDLRVAERHAMLAANSATVAVVASLMILNWIWRSGTNPEDITGMDERFGALGTEIFLRFMWDQVLPTLDVLKEFPGRDLGLRAGLSIQFNEGLSLQVAIKNVHGKAAWINLPYLHPVYRVYGSFWAKFFRNRGQSQFFKGNYTDSAYTSRPISFAIPTRTLGWISKMRGDYLHRESQMNGAMALPFEVVAGFSGEPYPKFSSDLPNIERKQRVIPLHISQPAGVGQACRYPITDLNGSLTMNLSETLMACEPDGPVDPPQNTDFMAPPILNRPPEGLKLFKCRKYSGK